MPCEKIEKNKNCIVNEFNLIFLDRGADVNAENGCGATPLHEAVSRGDATICQELLQAGSNPLIRALQG